jgi:predicted ATPase
MEINYCLLHLSYVHDWLVSESLFLKQNYAVTFQRKFGNQKMAGNNQLKYNSTDLDPEILSTPFEVQTNWHVITGAPCTGKTTLIDQLADKGFQTVEETARQYFERELAKGRTIDEVRQNGPANTRSITNMQLNLEPKLYAKDESFLDRGIPDCLTFFRVFGLDPNELLPECFHNRYASVFILDQLPLQRETALGPEDTVTADFLDEWLECDYNSLGYRVVRVPVLSPKERLTFVLDSLTEQGLI